jgi:hypothetical protein
MKSSSDRGLTVGLVVLLGLPSLSFSLTIAKKRSTVYQHFSLGYNLEDRSIPKNRREERLDGLIIIIH